MQLAALECAEEADPVAARIGAANTLVRQPGGGLKAYNTDWSAAISAVETALGGGASPHDGDSHSEAVGIFETCL